MNNLLRCVVLSFCITSCNASESTNADTNTEVEMPPEKSEYYIYLDDINSKILKGNAEQVNKGAKWESLKEFLGIPDYEAPLFTKKSNAQVGVIRVYYSRKLSKDLVNEKYDKSLRLYFSKDNILEDISTSL